MLLSSYAALLLPLICVPNGRPAAIVPGVDWPSFRGEFASGVSNGHACPTVWNVEKSEGVLWKTAIPGLSHSSPIVSGNKLFIATAVGAQANPQLKIGLYGDGTPADWDTAGRCHADVTQTPRNRGLRVRLILQSAPL